MEVCDLAHDTRSRDIKYFGKTRRKLPFPLGRYLKEAVIFKRLLAAERSSLSQFFETDREKILKRSNFCMDQDINLIDDGGLMPFHYLAYSLNKRKRWLIPEMIHSAQSDMSEAERFNSVSYFSVNNVSYKNNCNVYFAINEQKNGPYSIEKPMITVKPFFDFSNTTAFVPQIQINNPTLTNYLICYPVKKNKCHNYGFLTGSNGMKICSKIYCSKNFLLTIKMNDKNLRRYEKLQNRLNYKRRRFNDYCGKKLFKEFLDFDSSSFCEEHNEPSSKKLQQQQQNSLGTYDFFSMIVKKDSKMKSKVRKRQKSCKRYVGKQDDLKRKCIRYVTDKCIIEKTTNHNVLKEKQWFDDVPTMCLTKNEIERLKEKCEYGFWTRNSEDGLPYVIVINMSAALIPQKSSENVIVFRINRATSSELEIRNYDDVYKALLSSSNENTLLQHNIQLDKTKYLHLASTQKIDYHKVLFDFLRYNMNRKGSNLSNMNGICHICYEEKPLSCLTSDCEHMFCLDCWLSHLKVRIKSRMKPVCIAEKCNSFVLLGNLVSLFHMNSIIPLLYKITDEHILSQSSYVRCKSCLHLQRVSRDVLFFQCFCGVAQCRQCSFESHFPISCSLYKQYFKYLLTKGYTDHLGSEAFYFIKGKRCPSCRMVLNKNGGCNHMTCRCSYEFCWRCLSKWSESHYKCHINKENDENEEIQLITKDKLLNLAMLYRYKRLHSVVHLHKTTSVGFKYCKNSNDSCERLTNVMQEVYYLAEFLSAASYFSENSTLKVRYIATVKKLDIIAKHLSYLCNIVLINKNHNNVQALYTAADDAFLYVRTLCKCFKNLIEN